MRKRARVDLGYPPSFLVNGAAGTFAPSSIGGGGGSKVQRHAVGNWPSFVHIQLPGLRIPCGVQLSDDDEKDDDNTDDEAQQLAVNAQKAFQNCRQLLDPSIQTKTYFVHETNSNDSTSATIDGNAPTNVGSDCRHNWAHISLAKPFALRKHEIEPFVAMLRAEVKRLPAFSVSIASAWCLLPSDHGLLLPHTNGARVTQDTLSGDSTSSTLKANGINSVDLSSPSDSSGARCFAALELSKDLSGSHVAHNLARLVEAVDRVLQRFGRPPYFKPPHWHVTFAEIAESYDSAALKPLRERQGLGSPSNSSIQGGAVCHDESDDEEADFDVKEIEVKAGHLRFTLPLMAS